MIAAEKLASVTHITTVHPSMDVRIFSKMCCSLAAHGYDVRLIAHHERAEIRDGVRFIPLSGNQCSGRIIRFIRSVFEGGLAALRDGSMLIHFHDPELIPVGLFLRLCGRRVIYDIHEDLPRQVLTKYYIPPLFRWCLAKVCASLEWLAARVINGMITVTPAIARRFPKSKTVVVQNYPIANEMLTNSGLPYAERPLEFVYVGNLSEIRGAREMVQAIALVRTESARLRLIGEFDPVDLGSKLLPVQGWERIYWNGWVPRQQLADQLGQCRAGLVVFHPVPNHVEAQPNKMFEYMSAGLPVIASDFPLWRRIVTDARCGILVDPLNPHSIAEGLQWILDNPAEAEIMGNNGRRAIRETYNWEHESRQLLSFYQRVMNRA